MPEASFFDQSRDRQRAGHEEPRRFCSGLRSLTVAALKKSRSPLTGAALAGLVLALLVFSETRVPAQVGGGPPIVPVSPEAGAPQPWEAGLAASPFSLVNLFNGNCLTVVPLVGFVLYHNSASATGGGGQTAPWGFNLGNGWSVSFGGNVALQPGRVRCADHSAANLSRKGPHSGPYQASTVA